MCKVPDSPFILPDGKFAGLALESLIFTNPAGVVLLSKKNLALNQHLNFLFKAGENLPTIPYCSCGKNKVKHFIMDSGKPRYDLICCDDNECINNLIMHKVNFTDSDKILWPIRLSTLLSLKDQEEQKAAARFMKNVLGLSRRATSEDILELLSGHYKQAIALAA
jgi:hypothetical protein